MSSGRGSICLILLFVSSVCFANHITLNCQASIDCPGEDIAANCSGFDGDDLVVWSIYDTNAMSIGNVLFNSSNGLGTTQYLTAGGANFSFVKTSNSYSIASFTAVPGIDNFWLECSVYDDPNNVSESANCSISVDTALSTPQGLTFIDNSIQSTSVAVNWAPVSDMCVIGYVVSVYANGTSVITNTTTYNNYTIDRNITNVEYCVAVAAYRIDGTVGTPTNQLCITLDTPLPVVFNEPTYTLNQVDIATGLRISWTETSSTRPETTWYYVTVNVTYPPVSSGSGSGNGNNPMAGNQTDDFVSLRIRSNITFIYLDDSPLGTMYDVSIIAENVLGNGTASNLKFTITRPTPTPSTAIPVPSTTTTSSSTTTSPSTTPTSSTTDTTTTALETWKIAVIAIISVIGLALIVAIVIVSICCFCCCISRLNNGNDELEMKGTRL